MLPHKYKLAPPTYMTGTVEVRMDETSALVVESTRFAIQFSHATSNCASCVDIVFRVILFKVIITLELLMS